MMEQTFLGKIKELLDSYMVGAKSKSLAFVCKVRNDSLKKTFYCCYIRVDLDTCIYCKGSQSLQQSY